MAPAALPEVLEDAVRAHEAAAAAGGVRLTCECDAALRSVALCMDAGRVGQVITNFLSNAVKFTQSGGAVVVRAVVLSALGRTDATRGGHAVCGGGAGEDLTLRGGCARHSAPSGTTSDRVWTVRVSVADTGCGLGPAGLARLFQPFVQIRAADTQAGCVRASGSRPRALVHFTQCTAAVAAPYLRRGGTGLGLAICKQFIETGHGGTIGATSQPGLGSEFFFVVPFTAAAAVAPCGHVDVGAPEPAAVVAPVTAQGTPRCATTARCACAHVRACARLACRRRRVRSAAAPGPAGPGAQRAD
jgi:signal transduction histidine kinase